MEPIKLFIGTSANGEDADAEMVYEHSLREHVTGPLEITWMRQSHDPESIWGCWDASRWPTPFSGFRWAIPEACGFTGKALYTDVDMINFRDIRELWNTDLQGRVAAARRGTRFGGHEFCVMLIDCEKLGDLVMPVSRMKQLPESHFRLIQALSGSNAILDLDPRWNVLDGETLALDEMWQVHFTCMGSQPWTPSWYTGAAVEHIRPDLCGYWLNYRDRLNAQHAPKPQPKVDYDTYGCYTIIGR
jgi:hypothetical protein